MADRFEDLRNYVAVVSNGGVNAAAEAMGIAKSAVSRRLSELEARLGVTLIDRTTRRFELTAVGRDYHQRAVAILASLDALDRDVGGSRAPAEHVRVSAESELVTHLLAPALARFQAEHANMVVELTIAGPEPAAGPDVDILISTRAAPKSDEGLRLGEFRRLLCGAPSLLETRGSPTSISELAEYPGIAVRGQDAGWKLDGLQPQPFNLVMTVPDVASAITAAIEGVGLALLPKFAAREAIDGGKLTVVLADRLTKPTNVVASYRRESPARVRLLVKYLAATLAFSS